MTKAETIIHEARKAIQKIQGSTTNDNALLDNIHDSLRTLERVASKTNGI